MCNICRRWCRCRLVGVGGVEASCEWLPTIVDSMGCQIAFISRSGGGQLFECCAKKRCIVVAEVWRAHWRTIDKTSREFFDVFEASRAGGCEIGGGGALWTSCMASGMGVLGVA